jgi:hypothetical protein
VVVHCGVEEGELHGRCHPATTGASGVLRVTVRERRVWGNGGEEVYMLPRPEVS